MEVVVAPLHYGRALRRDRVEHAHDARLITRNNLGTARGEGERTGLLGAAQQVAKEPGADQYRCMTHKKHDISNARVGDMPSESFRAGGQGTMCTPQDASDIVIIHLRHWPASKCTSQAAGQGRHVLLHNAHRPNSVAQGERTRLSSEPEILTSVC